MSSELNRPFLRVQAIALMLGKSNRAVYHMLKDGTLQGCRLGRTWVIPKEHLLTFLKGVWERTSEANPRKRKTLKPRRGYMRRKPKVKT